MKICIRGVAVYHPHDGVQIRVTALAALSVLVIFWVHIAYDKCIVQCLLQIDSRLLPEGVRQKCHC